MGSKYKGTSLKRKDAFFVDFDTTKWLKQFDKKVEDFKGKGGAFERAVKRMIPLLQQYFTTFMQQHNKSGETLKSLMDASEAILEWGVEDWKKSVGFKDHRHIKVVKSDNVLKIGYGFKIDEGGLPSIFLDVGRPGIKYKNGTVSKEQKPNFFVYYAIDKYLRSGKFGEIFKEEVMKELEGLL